MACGSNASVQIEAEPTSRKPNSDWIPPTWVNGNTIAKRSAGVVSNASFTPRAAAATVASVCIAPFGSAVVPDV